MEDKNNFAKLNIDFTDYETKLTAKFSKRKPYKSPDPAKVKAYIPGIITDIFVYVGQQVKRGDKLLILEAMKMKNNVSSPRDGKIKKINAAKSKMVVKNETLIEFD